MEEILCIAFEKLSKKDSKKFGNHRKKTLFDLQKLQFQKLMKNQTKTQTFERKNPLRSESITNIVIHTTVFSLIVSLREKVISSQKKLPYLNVVRT